MATVSKNRIDIFFKSCLKCHIYKTVIVPIGAKSSSIGKKNTKKTKTFLSKDLGDGLGKYFSSN
jgi:hypothetical protein